MKYFTKQMYIDQEKLWDEYYQEESSKITKEMHDFTGLAWDAYHKHLEQIWPMLPESIKDIIEPGKLHNMHDCIVDESLFVDDNFCIRFYDNGVRFGKVQVNSVDFTNIKGGWFDVDELIFTNAKIIASDFEASSSDIFAGWVNSEVYICPDGYEMHILLGLIGNYTPEESYAELTITFKDVIIKPRKATDYHNKNHNQ